MINRPTFTIYMSPRQYANRVWPKAQYPECYIRDIGYFLAGATYNNSEYMGRTCPSTGAGMYAYRHGALLKVKIIGYAHDNHDGISCYQRMQRKV